ncbi:MAG: BACON domain-containing protein [Bacteroidales bacterium]|nr:BACON domain-containing protein [Bacteroidales bacterium]
MNIKHYLFAVLAGAILAAGCQKNEDPMALKADIKASVETLDFEQNLDSKEFDLTSTRDWKMNPYEEGVDWVSVTPESGDAAVKARKLTVTVRANSGHDRETDLSFTNGTKTIAVHVYQKGPDGPGGPIFKATFDNSLSGFTVEDKTSWADGGSAWTADSHGYAKATGKVGSVFNASDSYLVSPVIDLTGENAAWLQFRHAAYSSAISKDASVLVREEGQTEWTKLEPETWPTNWSFVSAGDMDLKAWLGKKIQIAFRFTSTSSASDTWEIDNVEVSREGTPVVECATVADVVAQKNNTKVHVSNMTVQLVYAHGYLVSDGTDYLLVYLGEETTPDVKPGDVLSMNAALTFYSTSGATYSYPQLISPKEVETTATGRTVTLPEPSDLTPTCATFSIDPATEPITVPAIHES